ncbi:hypothetical protein, partial [Allochromatium vinosum]|uniref:hypothetical protein n=1 Tax=Allochromatium vinosum TaxID=1049 RepID=UPI001906C274
MNAPTPQGATAPVVDPDRLPAEVRASIQAQAPAFELEPPELVAPPTPEAIRALVETIKARDDLSEAAIADAIGMKKQNFSHAKTGYRGKTLSAEQWRALQDLAQGENYPQSERETVTEPRRCRETADMFEASVDNSVTDPAPFDLAEAIAQGAEITARAGELEADSDLQADLERLAEYEHQHQPVELACFSPDEGKTADAPLAEVQAPES